MIRDRLVNAQGRRESDIKKVSSMKKKADPYTLNDGVGHPDPYDKGLDVYQKDKPHSEGPSGWAEDVDTNMRWKDDGKSNEVGLPAARKEAKEAQARKVAVEKAQKEQIKTTAHATNCIKIAESMFPNAIPQFIAEAAADLMSLSPNAVKTQLDRIAAYEAFDQELEQEAAKEEEKDEVEAAKKEEVVVETAKEDNMDMASQMNPNEIKEAFESLKVIASSFGFSLVDNKKVSSTNALEQKLNKIEMLLAKKAEDDTKTKVAKLNKRIDALFNKIAEEAEKETSLEALEKELAAVEQDVEAMDAGAELMSMTEEDKDSAYSTDMMEKDKDAAGKKAPKVEESEESEESEDMETEESEENEEDDKVKSMKEEDLAQTASANSPDVTASEEAAFFANEDNEDFTEVDNTLQAMFQTSDVNSVLASLWGGDLNKKINPKNVKTVAKVASNTKTSPKQPVKKVAEIAQAKNNNIKKASSSPKIDLTTLWASPPDVRNVFQQRRGY